MSRRANPRTLSTEREHLASLESARVRGGVSRRKALGAHYTPSALVDHLVQEAFHEIKLHATKAEGPKSFCGAGAFIDPACGSGNFLVAMTRAWAHRSGESIEHVLSNRVFGIDIDREAVRLAHEALLALLPSRTRASTRARVAQALASHVIHGDALEPHDRARLGVSTFDMVLGNPPFLGQLKRGTAATRTRARVVSRATGGAVRRYADGAAAFLLVGLELLKPNGRLAFVMPLSFLSASDSHMARAKALETAHLTAIWSASEGLFEDANVRVCGLVFERIREIRSAREVHGVRKGEDRRAIPPRTRDNGKREVRRAFGGDFTALPSSQRPPLPADPTWSPLLAEAFGAPPSVVLTCRGETIAKYANATADFRDQYYGLRGALCEISGEGLHVRSFARAAHDAVTEIPLITTKHVDLARCRWGTCDVRILGSTMRRPAVDCRALVGSPKMTAWLAQRRVPKVLVATQTKVMEAWVDEAGATVPLVPLLTVTPHRASGLWNVAAAIASPVVASRAVALYAGTALSAGAIKLSAKQLLEMPVPSDRGAWVESARIFRSASRAVDEDTRTALLVKFAETSCRAHGLRGKALAETMQFWKARAQVGATTR